MIRWVQVEILLNNKAISKLIRCKMSLRDQIIVPLDPETDNLITM